VSKKRRFQNGATHPKEYPTNEFLQQMPLLEPLHIEPVDDAIVDRTLPFLPPIVADMVRVQRLCGMRPQDVRNMRAIDIDRTQKVWRYVPFTHKTEHQKKL